MSVITVLLRGPLPRFELLRGAFFSVAAVLAFGCRRTHLSAFFSANSRHFFQNLQQVGLDAR
jgi:hypothetical protein